MKSIFSFCVFMFASMMAFSQSTEEIIRKHIDAIGGEENWNSIHSIEIKSVTKAKGNTVYLKKSIIKDSCMRNDMRIEFQKAGRSEKYYYVLINQDKGWSYLPEDRNNMITTMFPNEIAETKDELDYEDPFLNYLIKRRDIFLLNVETIAGKEYYIFEITYPTKKKVICYMNTETLMIDVMKNVGESDDNAKRFIDYKLLPEGIRMPTKVISFNSSLIVDEITINPTFKIGLFEPTTKNGFSYMH